MEGVGGNRDLEPLQGKAAPSLPRTLLWRRRGGTLPARRSQGRRVALLHGIATPGSSGQESLCVRVCICIGTCLTQRECSLSKLSRPLAAGKTSVPLRGIYRCVSVCTFMSLGVSGSA